MEGNTALDAQYLLQTAVACDIGSLGSPWRQRAKTRRNQEKIAGRLLRQRRFAVGQQFFQHGDLRLAQWRFTFGKVPVLCRNSQIG
ncbi:hypothetical protein D3C85_1754060 [compost metagenome]